MATEAEIAWLAGIIEGEGCIQIATNGRSVSVTVGMTDRDVIERIDRLFPAPSILAKQPKRPDGTPYRTQYVWRIRRAEQVREVLALVMPWLGERRRASATAALEYLDTRPGGPQRKTHCAQGHEFTPENTYTDADGYSNCRTCRARWNGESRARKPAGWKWRGASRACEFCGKQFRPSTPRQRTCDRKCGAGLRWRASRPAELDQDGELSLS